MNHTTQARAARRLSLSLTAKICITATSLVVLSLGVTSTFIGVKSSHSAEEEAIAHATTLTREAAAKLQSRIASNLATVSGVATGLEASLAAQQPLVRDQVNALVHATLVRNEDFVGNSATFEPNALDGKDAEHAGVAPHYDATGRYMPYFSRGADGKIGIEPIVFGDKAEMNAWYDVPKATGKVFFSEPYAYPINGKEVLIASLVAPIAVNGKLQGAVTGDLMLTKLGAILAEMKLMEGGTLDLVSNGGLYASNKDHARNGKKAEDLPAAALDAVRAGQPYHYLDDHGMLHLLQPVRIHPDIAPLVDLAELPAARGDRLGAPAGRL